MKTMEEIQKEIVEDFSFFEEWMDKYEEIIEFGKSLKGLPEELKTEENLVRGCQSNVWVVSEMNNGLLHFEADSDAIITKGIVGLLLRIFSGQRPIDIATEELYALDEIGLQAHLSPNRANGLNAMVNKIKLMALAHRAKEEAEG
ncbi:MAG TPA: Fe-S metabolism protein SufE [Flavobacteriales bacterium]|nr:Fe-S metabolism protein SufE [Flavobacteriales bacterium]